MILNLSYVPFLPISRCFSYRKLISISFKKDYGTFINKVTVNWHSRNDGRLIYKKGFRFYPKSLKLRFNFLFKASAFVSEVQKLRLASISCQIHSVN